MRQLLHNSIALRIFLLVLCAGLISIGGIALINCDLIEYVEETPDTVITLTTGRKLIVKESRQEIKNLVKSYKREIYHG